MISIKLLPMLWFPPPMQNDAPVRPPPPPPPQDCRPSSRGHEFPPPPPNENFRRPPTPPRFSPHPPGYHHNIEPQGHIPPQGANFGPPAGPPPNDAPRPLFPSTRESQDIREYHQYQIQGNSRPPGLMQDSGKFPRAPEPFPPTRMPPPPQDVPRRSPDPPPAPPQRKPLFPSGAHCDDDSDGKKSGQERGEREREREYIYVRKPRVALNQPI